MAFDINMIREVYKKYPTSVDTARAALAILSQDSDAYNVSSITDYRTG